MLLIASGTLFLIYGGGKKIPAIPLTLVVLLFTILSILMIKQVYAMLHKLKKYRFVTIDTDSVTVGISAAFKDDINLIQEHLYNRANLSGVHNDKTFIASEIILIKERKNGILLKASGLMGAAVIIPNEMDNLTEIKQEITKMIPS